MTGADWGLLVPVIVSLGGALAAWLRAQAARSAARDASVKADNAKAALDAHKAAHSE